MHKTKQQLEIQALQNKLRCIDLQELMTFWHISKLDVLYKHPLENLLDMYDKMQEAKKTDNILKKQKDAEFEHIVTTYLEIYPMLTQYWSKEQIIKACAEYANVNDIIDEIAISVEKIGSQPEGHCPWSPSEYLRTSTEHVNRYTKSGEQLMEGEYKKCHVYRTKNRYQSLVHGDIILKLLYDTYPELEEFQFSAYGVSYDDKDYEIYPNNNIYTPFHALMKSDIAAIITRNKNYCESYNSGIYTPEDLQKRLESDEVKHYFDVIRSLKPIKTK